MSAPPNGRKLAGLSLDDILTNPAPPSSAAPQPPPTKQPPPAPAILASIHGRTLLDIIRDEEPKSYKALIGKRDHKKPWTSFKGRLHLKKPANSSSAAAWSSSIKVPTSDVPLHYNPYRRHRQPRSASVRYVTPDPPTMSDSGDSSAAANRPCPSFTRRSSTRYTPPDDFDGSPRHPFDTGEARSMFSAREAVAAQQAAEAAAEAAAAAEEEEDESDDENEDGEFPSGGGGGGGGAGEAAPMKMSLMDLLEETDREMGLEGGRYVMDEEEEEEEEVAAAEVEVEGGEEYDCCVCMVKHRGSACSPCGHTFCRMCSRELKVQRGNCPLCNDYVLEILDIF